MLYIGGRNIIPRLELNHMGKKKDGLIEILAQYFWNYKSYEIEGVMKSYGISPDETLDP